MTRTFLIVYTGLALVALVVQWFVGDLGQLIQYGQGPGGLAADLGIGVGTGLVMVVAMRPLDRLASGARLDAFLRELLTDLKPKDALMIALVGSFAEELLFRGVIQPHLGLWITAILFGVVHHPGRRDLILWPLVAIIMGGFFGALFLWRGTLLVPGLAHFTINYFNLHQLLVPRTEP